MNEGFRKFEVLMKTDPEFQAKLKKAAESYAGDKAMQAVFHNILEPLAGEYGIFGNYEDFKGYLESIPAGSDAEMSESELAQVAGGKSGLGGGLGLVACFGVGIGGGAGAGTDSGGACIAVGLGYGRSECIGVGESGDL